MQLGDDCAQAAVPHQVRSACAWVAPRARFVRIEEAEIGAYAATLAPPAEPPPAEPESHLLEGDRESRAAFVVCLDAINFGSGWWPTIRKRPGRSGYFTIAAGLTEQFREAGAWNAADLVELGPGDLATTLDQDPSHPLMADYAAALRDVGERLLADHGGRFEGLLDAAGGSAASLAGILAGWPSFADVSTYEGRPIPFYKRAQIAAADLNRTGVVRLRGEERLTAFADNLVPHVLRIDGILNLDRALEAKIDAGDLISHGSPEEIELRACAVHAIELLAGISGIPPAQLDGVLWNRGRADRYKSVPRPRSRNTAY
ncbi:MAG: queuosine salvage family protein [Solirubrobacterales bacterium]